jgi:acetyl-CoA acetyltransferase
MTYESGSVAIAGMGVGEQGRRLGIPVRELRRIALERALDDSGLARTDVVACVYAAAPTMQLSAPASTGGAPAGGYGPYAYGYAHMYGMIGAAAAHALHARRHMHRYGTTSRHLGAAAVTQREYASRRPGTLGYGQPITIDDHQGSRMVVAPSGCSTAVVTPTAAWSCAAPHFTPLELLTTARAADRARPVRWSCAGSRWPRR